MRLNLENVGMVRKASIEINGITVIAGENNTGKSTIGKSLFSVFHSFYKIEEKIKKERMDIIARTLLNCSEEIGGSMSLLQCQSIASNIIKKEGYDFTKEDEQNLVLQLITEFSNSALYMEGEIIKKYVDKIRQYMMISDDEIMNRIVKNSIEAEFGLNIGNVNFKSEVTKINLEIRNKNILLCIFRNKEVKIEKKEVLTKNIIYMDDPFILDDINAHRVLKNINVDDHRNDLIMKLISKTKKENGMGMIDELVLQKKLESIFRVMNQVCRGTLIKTDDIRLYAYQSEDLNENLDINNLSTGIKSFMIIKILLENGSMEENGTIILDEPEIHLHPKWQLVFAELIVLLQKELGIHILLNTHSPYFLNAIEVFSARHGIQDKCEYYLTYVENGNTEIKNVTDKTELIYEKLARPLQDLENMEYTDETDYI